MRRGKSRSRRGALPSDPRPDAVGRGRGVQLRPRAPARAASDGHLLSRRRRGAAGAGRDRGAGHRPRQRPRRRHLHTAQIQTSAVFVLLHGATGSAAGSRGAATRSRRPTAQDGDPGPRLRGSGRGTRSAGSSGPTSRSSTRRWPRCSSRCRSIGSAWRSAASGRRELRHLLGLQNGDLFTHVAAFSPGFFVGNQRRGRPLFYVSHGKRDQILPFDTTSRRIVPTLEEAAYSVRFKEFGGGGGGRPGGCPSSLRHDRQRRVLARARRPTRRPSRTGS